MAGKVEVHGDDKVFICDDCGGSSHFSGDNWNEQNCFCGICADPNRQLGARELGSTDGANGDDKVVG